MVVVPSNPTIWVLGPLGEVYVSSPRRAWAEVTLRVVSGGVDVLSRAQPIYSIYQKLSKYKFAPDI